MTANDSARDPFELRRFEEAQASNYADALVELGAGQKRSHWMWYVFPQVDGLGSSRMARRYAIKSRGEAEAYLAHPVLGPRLVRAAEALLGVRERTASEIMGHPDDLKLRSSMTLFAQFAGPGSVFQRVLERYYGGVPDERTLEIFHEFAR